MAIDCPGCLPAPSQADTTFELAPRIDWPDLYHLHQTQASYDSFCETIDQYDSHLNASIEAIRKTVLHLRALRNSRGVVHRLPPEILIHILSELMFTSDPPSSTNLVAATHVCRRWRAVALDCPVLWTNIVGVNLHKTETFVQRSRDLLLGIHIDLVSFFRRQPPEVPHLRNLGLGVLHDRLRSLTVITGNSSSDLNWLDMFGEQLARKPAPHLIALHLLNTTSEGPGRTASCGYRARTSSPDLYGITDHPPFTDPPTPALRSLRLDSTFLSWDSEIYKNLAVLDVDARRPGRYPLSEDKMLDILQECPKLVELRIRLKGDFADPDVPSDDHTRDVILPFLSTLSLEDFTPTCVETFLSHLTLPACTDYRLSLDQSDLEEDYHRPDFPWVFPEDMSRLSGVSTTKTAELHVEKEFFLRLYSTDAETVPSTVHFSSTRKNEYGSSYWVVAIPEDVLESTERFVVVNSPWHSYLAFEWREIFRRAPHLRTLRLVRPDADDIYDALRALAPSIVPGVDEELMCPQLECIEIVGRISSLKDWNEERAEDMVRSRCHGDHKAPFQRLVLEDGVMSELCVSRLRDLPLDVVICPREECSSGPDDDTLSGSESE